MKKISESSIQQSAFLWLNNNHGLKHHSPRLYMFSIPNESILLMASILKGYRVPDSIVNKSSSIVLDKVKSTGMRNGVPDTIVLLPNRILFCEFKTEIGNQSTKQREFQLIVESLGRKYYIVRNLEHFKEVILKNI